MLADYTLISHARIMFISLLTFRTISNQSPGLLLEIAWHIMAFITELSIRIILRLMEMEAQHPT